ncbi:hypothetical protein [Sphingomonas sp.]|uniref:hypothetical protein n=1 Tax=Sphingomonas sp. TaxID=28214 RepID=UPI0035BC16FE
MPTRAKIADIEAEGLAEVERRAAKRRAAIGMFKHLVGDRNINIQHIKADDRWDEHYGRKFADLC